MDVDETESDPESRDESGEMHCEMVLCIDTGPAFELKWCPLPCNDSSEVRLFSLSHSLQCSYSRSIKGSEQKPKKLGILAGTFEDGSTAFYAVPDPTTLEKPEGHDETAPLFGKALSGS